MSQLLQTSLLPAALLLALAASGPAGCGGDMVVELDTPLVVLESYPASGAEVPHEALAQIKVTFSRDLGLRAASLPDVTERVRVESSPDGRTWTAIAIDSFGYDQEHQTLSITLLQATVDRLMPGNELRVVLEQGLQAEDGSLLPRDRYLFFRVAE